MSIESAARAMLISGSTISLVPDSRVTHGYRLQESALPAITFELSETELITVGSAPLRATTMQINCVAESTLDAIAIGAQVRSACVPGTFDSIVFHAVAEQGFSVDPATVADGDEAQPAVFNLTFRITFQE